MERKLLWVISSIVILILWLKIEPQGTQQTGSKTVTAEQPAPESVPDQPKRENSREANVTEEEQEYFRQLSGLSSNTSVNGKVDPLSKMDLDKDLLNRLFGGTEVNIQPQGNIDLTFGVDFQNIENPILTKRQQKQGGFDFDMAIQLNVQGSIGEKLKLSTNYNTQATFDFDNQLKLEYDADAFSEDEIIKKIRYRKI